MVRGKRAGTSTDAKRKLDPRPNLILDGKELNHHVMIEQNLLQTSFLWKIGVTEISDVGILNTTLY